MSEIVLVAQDLAAYGRDLDATPRRPDITGLLTCLSEVEDLRVIRLLYLHPHEIRPGLIDAMTANPKVASYFDLSLQHATRRLLRAMKRPGGADTYLELIGSIRARHPQATLRSSFIVGLPGETDDDVEELAGFLDEARLDWAGFFPYSAEAGTPAANMPGRPDSDEVGERLRYLHSRQDELTARANLELVGSRVELVIDQLEDGVPVGRSYRQAPDIDGVIILDRGEPGEWAQADITAAFGPDLGAKRVGA